MPFFLKDPHTTQEALAHQANVSFETRGRDPLAWQGYALTLREGARVLWDHVNAASDAKQTRERFGLMLVAMMLAGLAIEVLAKALLVRENPRLIVYGKWKGSTHNLVSLVARTNLPIKPEEREVLSQLSGFVKFAGRYPIPTRSEDLTPKLEPAQKGKWRGIELAPGTWIPAEAPAIFEDLFRQLNERLEGTR